MDEEEETKEVEAEPLPKESFGEEETKNKTHTHYALVVAGLALMLVDYFNVLPTDEIFGVDFLTIWGIILLVIGIYPLLTKKEAKELTDKKVKGLSSIQLIDYIYRHYKVIITAGGGQNLASDLIAPQVIVQDPNPKFLRILFTIDDSDETSSIPIEERGYYNCMVIAINRYDPTDFRYQRIKLPYKLDQGEKNKRILELPLTESRTAFEPRLDTEDVYNKLKIERRAEQAEKEYLRRRRW